MTQVIGSAFNDAQRLGRETLTSEQQAQARSINNTYRKALAKINLNTHVVLYMGNAKSKILSTDLMVILRDCLHRLSSKHDLSPNDYAFYAGKLRHFSRMRYSVYISITDLLRLRKIVSAAEEVEARMLPVPKSGVTLKKLLANDRLARSNILKKGIKKEPPVSGCLYHDPGSGSRCGIPCESTRCDAHRDADPAYNGAGSLFYAKNPNQRSARK